LEPVGSRRMRSKAQIESIVDVDSMAIRAGDRLTVDQDSQTLRARFGAVALESAGIGQQVRVRLIMGNGLRLGKNVELTAPGPVVPVTVTGPGSAQWQTEILSGGLPADEQAKIKDTATDRTRR
jgi:hypothetical protein